MSYRGRTVPGMGTTEDRLYFFSGSADLPPGLTESEFAQLSDLEMDAIEQRQIDLIGRLARGWLDDKVLNQPIRANGKTLEVEIGHLRLAAVDQMAAVRVVVAGAGRWIKTNGLHWV